MNVNNKKITRQTTGLHIVDLFEGAKGTLLLIAGFGLLALIHRDLDQAAEEIVRRFHMNPAHHYPKIFIDAATHAFMAGLGGNCTPGVGGDTLSGWKWFDT